MRKRNVPTPNNDTDVLSPQQLRFITEYLKNGRNGTQAALAAGYAPKNAGRQAHVLLTTSRKIKEFLATATKEAAKEVGVYSLQDAMTDANEAIQFAIATNNANARVKAVELKMKLHGLLIERHDIRSPAPFSFTILPFGASAPQPIDVTPTQEALPPGQEVIDVDATST